jgi:predicted small secreted protein
MELADTRRVDTRRVDCVPYQVKRSSTMKTITTTLSVLVLAGLAACNTFEGAGEDVEAGGDAISDTARETERDLEQ